MHARFYAPDLAGGDRLVDLPPEEAAHLSRVLRLRVGAEVRVFDGLGHEFAGRVRVVEGARVSVEIGDAVTPAPEPRVRLTLVQAVPKGDLMDQVVRDAAMVGVAAVVPLVSARSEVTLARLLASGRAARWQRIAVASVKQCGRAVVPVVLDPAGLASALERAPTGIRDLCADPAPASAVLVVGPEGGWTDAEIALAAAAGCRRLTLGGRTLRSGAAALVGVTALQCAWGDL